MPKLDLLSSLRRAAVPVPAAAPAPAPLPAATGVAQEPPSPVALVRVGAPIRNRAKAPSVQRREERGVRTLSLSLFAPQRAKLQALTNFLFEHDLRRSASLTVRACFQMSSNGPDMLAMARAVTDGVDYKKVSVAIYDAEQTILKDLTRYFIANGLDVAESVCGRAVIELAQANGRFLEVARDLEERQDRRGKKAIS
jgi:hypothetical protein